MKQTRRSLCLAVYFLLALVHAACASPPLTDLPSLTTETPAENVTPSPLPTQTYTPQPTAAPAATRTPEPGTPTETPIPLYNIEPLVTAAPFPPLTFGLRFDSWSPDSQWIAYWVGERAEGHPAQLAFANVLSGQACQHAEVSAQDLDSGSVLWQADGRAIAVLYPQQETLSGVPCETFAPVENIPLPDHNTHVYDSPDGRYRAKVSIVRLEEASFYTDVTITDLETGQPVVTTSYIDSPHIVGRPMWLNNELFLIGKTVDQGIHYIALPEGQVGNVFPDLLGLEAGGEEQIWRVDGHAGPATGEYHLLLVGLKGASGSPLLLYHSEIDRLEEIPFYSTWFLLDGTSFSPDGKWLFVGDPFEKGEPGPSNDYWLRLVDPPGSTAVEITHDLGPGGLSIQAQKMAFFAYSSIHIFGFPDARLISQWNAPGYDVQSTWWSPDGSRLIAMGSDNQTGGDALFVIQIP